MGGEGGELRVDRYSCMQQNRFLDRFLNRFQSMLDIQTCIPLLQCRGIAFTTSADCLGWPKAGALNPKHVMLKML